VLTPPRAAKLKPFCPWLKTLTRFPRQVHFNNKGANSAGSSTANGAMSALPPILTHWYATR